ncbi:RNA-dependent RNA polymerase [Trifolium repens]|jgi:hypothetical protein|nr:RNA-dependent RNA polymerase [Trifolium repens]
MHPLYSFLTFFSSVSFIISQKQQKIQFYPIRSIRSTRNMRLNSSNYVLSEKFAKEAYDHQLEVNGFEVFLETALSQEKCILSFYGSESEDEMLTGNLQNRAFYLQRDNRRYGHMKDRILISDAIRVV